MALTPDTLKGDPAVGTKAKSGMTAAICWKLLASWQFIKLQKEQQLIPTTPLSAVVKTCQTFKRESNELQRTTMI